MGQTDISSRETSSFVVNSIVPRRRNVKTPVDMDLANKLMRGCQMQLPAEEVPWVTSWPDCALCVELTNSGPKNHVCPHGGTVDDFTYVCPACGRRWKQFIVHAHLWRHVTDYLDWQALRRQQIIIDAGLAF